MEIYDTEEQQVEALKIWWKENGPAVLVGLVVGIIAIFAVNYWQDNTKERQIQASNLYEQSLKAADENKNDEVEKLSLRIQDQYKGTEYAAYSALLLAKTKVQQNDLAAAKKILQTVLTSSDKQNGHIARIRLVRLMLATGEFEQGLQLINEVDAKAESGFSGSYDELTGDLYVALNRPDEARSSYQSALRNGQQSPLLQFKIDDLTAPEKVEIQK
jgi:predicted negative regulator of RcsB-dependent stress response